METVGFQTQHEAADLGTFSLKKPDFQIAPENALALSIWSALVSGLKPNWTTWRIGMS
jgi:hypothetical protein